MERSSGYLWGGIALVAAVLLTGAWLGTRAVAGSQPDAAEGATTVSAEYARYIAPDSACPGAGDLGASIPVQQQTTMCLVNYARAKDGLAPLNVNSALMKSAELKVQDIVRCADFSHDACGVDVRQRFADSGYFRADVQTAFGENLAWGGAEAGSPRGALLGWLDSPEHRANMFKADWREQGMALAYVPDFRGVASSRIWVSHFGRQG
jgi:uncharacterized protein YkwD